MTVTTARRLEAQREFAASLRRCSRLTQTALEQLLSKAGLNSGQWSALRIIVEMGEISVGDLSREAEMTSGAMTRLIDCLEERGLVIRVRSATDRRLVNVLSTPAAEDMVQAIIPVVTAAWSEILGDFPTQDIAELAAHLDDLVAALERRTSRITGRSVGLFALHAQSVDEALPR